MIKREKYIEPIREFYSGDLIKVITGIRRCGKSVILKQILDEIREKSDNIIFLDFEDTAVLNAIPDEMALLSYIDNHRKESLCYVFLDEIQRVEGWAGACRTLRIRNCSVFISGSNSKLLSREFTKELSGRYVPFRIRPFVYSELKEYGKELGKEVMLNDYIIWGGFPKRIEFSEDSGQRIYLNELNETIILNDIINRYKIRKSEVFKRLANFIFLSNGRILSARSVEKNMRGAGLPCSVTTITKYIGYLEEAYAIATVKKYSAKSKRELEYYLKIYDEDVALNSIRIINNRYDLSHNFENVVYNELVYMGYNLQVYHDGSREIDFVANKGNKQYYIQVAYSVAEEKAYEREISAFAKLDNSCQKIIITNDDIDYSTSTVRHIKFRDFVQMDEL
ncbi:MAG: ATP-binding protein [Lachnospiraceae bacterium]|nr:ATP-binding protein [Lachnospiraceae bacterium]